jgi:hypothetical protein
VYVPDIVLRHLELRADAGLRFTVARPITPSPRIVKLIFLDIRQA